MRSSRQEVADRRSELVTLVQSGVTSANDLADRLDVSPATVRRDLAALEDLGRVVRTYGGARRAPFTELPLAVRAEKESAAKHAIAQLAVEYVPATGVIFLDTGSTCAALAALIEPHEDLTVVTRGLSIAALLANRGVNVIMVGGSVAKLSQGTAGPFAEEILRSLRFSIAFCGVDALDPAEGIGEPTVEEISVKKLVAARSDNLVILADYTKLAPSTVACWTRPERWTLITDDSDSPFLPAFEKDGVTVRRAAVSEARHKRRP